MEDKLKAYRRQKQREIWAQNIKQRLRKMFFGEEKQEKKDIAIDVPEEEVLLVCISC